MLSILVICLVIAAMNPCPCGLYLSKKNVAVKNYDIMIDIEINYQDHF